ncbi:MAG: phage virion morphogenesis protein [Steroidobacteraceae bacterium]
MSGARITYRFEDRAAVAAIERLIALRMQVMRPIGIALVQTTQERFRAARDPFGQPWAPLNPAYAAVKRGPGILRERGMLMRSITYRAGVDEVEVGSNRRYAAIHQFGGTIVPKSARALRFRLGRRVVYARAVTIPQRPYLGFGPEDRRAVLEVLEEAVQTALEA